jgi:hypothetical protein
MQQKVLMRQGFDFLRFCPHPAQLPFIAGRECFTQRACLCGTGSGKTKVGCYEDLAWALLYPGSVGYIFEPSYPMIKRILFPTLESKDLLGCSFPFKQNPYVAEFNRGDMRLTFWNGSQWWFVSLDDPERAEGPNVDYIHIDEARLVRHLDTAWLTSVRRLRKSGRCTVSVKPSIWLTTTTDFPGSDLFNITENPKSASPEMKVYRWSIFDNLTLSKEYVAEILRTHTGGLAERFVYGRFANVGAGSFPFDTSVHVRECPDKKLLKEIRYGVDFGWSNPSAIVCIGYDYDDRVYVLDEFYKPMVSKEDLLEKLGDFQALYGRGEVLCDSSEPEAIAKFNAGVPERRLLSIQASAYLHKREDGIRELGSRFPKAGDGLPRIFIARHCVNLISELLEYSVEVKERDHAVDALRYALKLKSYAPLGAFRFG